MLSSTLIPVTFNGFKNIGGWVVRLSDTTGSYPLVYDADSTDTIYIGFGLAEDQKKYRVFDGIQNGYNLMYVPLTYSGQKVVFNADITPGASPTTEHTYPNDNTSFTLLDRKYKPYAISIPHISSNDITLTAQITDQTISDFVWINEIDNNYTTDTTCLIIKREMINSTASTGAILINDFFKLKDDILYYYGVPVYRHKSGDDHLVIKVEKIGNRRLFIINNTILESALITEDTTFTSIKTITFTPQKYNYFVYIGSY